jgi:hypothetical protein
MRGRQFPATVQAVSNGSTNDSHTEECASSSAVFLAYSFGWQPPNAVGSLLVSGTLTTRPHAYVNQILDTSLDANEFEGSGAPGRTRPLG